MGAIEARIVAPGERWDDNPVFDNASTMVMQSSGTSRVVGILKAIGAEVPTRGGHEVFARALDAELAKEPEVQITIKWEGYCSTDEVTVAKGAKAFPPDGQGGHKGVMECPKCHGEVSAQGR